MTQHATVMNFENVSILRARSLSRHQTGLEETTKTLNSPSLRFHETFEGKILARLRKRKAECRVDLYGAKQLK